MTDRVNFLFGKEADPSEQSDMKRVLKLTVESRDEGLTVERFLKSRLCFSGKQISRLKFREAGIRVNGIRRRVTFRLAAGDLLELELEDAFGYGRTSKVEACRGSSDLHILMEDRDLLVVEKPAGVVCHPSHGHHLDTLANQAAAYLRGRGDKSGIRLAGRLDRDTSGIVVFAKNRETAAALARQRESGRMKKTYLAFTEGVPLPASGIVDAAIGKEPGSLMKMQVSSDGKPARTCYRVRWTARDGEKPAAVVELRLEHGRTHQIRVHMAYIGCPLAGDPLYGTDPSGNGALLHAWRLRLIQPFTGKEIFIETELPAWCPPGSVTG